MNKPLPTPNAPGNTEAERMSNALSMVLSVSTKDLLKKVARLKRANEKKRAKKDPPPESRSLEANVSLLKRIGRPIYHASFRLQVHVRCWCSDLVAHRSEQGLPFPPALLRYRVSESLSKGLFLRIGEGSVAHIEHQIRMVGGDLGSTRRVLDFGCGCGRTLRWLIDKYPDSEFYGADVDSDAIDWCARHMGRGRFARIDPEPPVPYPAEYFDVVYCFSVFTHLNEHMQNLRLLDLRRVLKPGGILLLTVHGEGTARDHLEEHEIEELRIVGLIHKTTRKLSGIVPDWYNTTWHSQQYIVMLLRSLFQDVHYTVVPDGAQDLVLARAPKR